MNTQASETETTTKPSPSTPPDLLRNIREIVEVCRSSKTGPLQVAGRVIALSDRWEKDGFHQKTEMDFATFLREHLGNNVDVRYFTVRHDAVKQFGLRQACMMEHQAAVWLFGRRLGGDEEKQIIKKVAHAFKQQNDNPLTLPQLKGLYKNVLGDQPKRAKSCSDCKKKDVEIAQLRAELAAMMNN